MMREKYFMEDSDDNAFSLIADFEGNEEQMFDVKIKSGDTLPVLPLRNMVLFPGVFMPVSVGRKSSLRLIREAEKKNMNIAVVCQKVAQTDEPQFEDLHTIGTIGKIVRILEMPDQTTTVILQGLKRLELTGITETHPYLKGSIEVKDEIMPDKNDKEFQALVETCKDLTIRYIKSSDSLHQDSAFAIKNISNHMFLVDFICTNLPLKKDEKIEELTDKLTRQMAEFDNFRKRTEKEKSQMYEVGAKDIIEKILPVVDNFERGLDAVPEEKKEDPFIQGMEKVYKQFMTVLESVEVKPIEALGNQFDPNFHNAVMHVEDENFGENEVAEEFQKGYMYRDSVVRHSMVKVAN